MRLQLRTRVQQRCARLFRELAVRTNIQVALLCLHAIKRKIAPKAAPVGALYKCATVIGHS